MTKKNLKTKAQRQKKINLSLFKPISKTDLLVRGYCCGMGCQNCPYLPKHTYGSRKIA